jgi:hypothetical protein
VSGKLLMTNANHVVVSKGHCRRKRGVMLAHWLTCAWWGWGGERRTARGESLS